MSDSFTPKLGRIGWKQGTRLDRYINKVMRAAQTAGQVNGNRSSGFTGSRMGRGSAFGTLAAAGLYPGNQRRVIVKARFTRFKAGNMGAARAHLRYIQRDGVTPEGAPGQFYSRNLDDADSSAFLNECEGDRHQFRLIVSPEDGAQLQDLKPFIRDFMAQVERDLETKLEWVAVDHYNTGQPHTHIVIRGKDDRGQDLVITRDYMSHGFRMRARELVAMELGPELEYDMTMKLARDVNAERLTRLDRAILKHVDQGFLVVSAMPPEDRQTHASHMGRLKTLQSLGLAEEKQTGVWQIAPDIETKLRSLGHRGDIIKTMHRVLKEAGIERPGSSFAMFDTAKAGNRIVGRVAGIGLTDEITDRHYVVVDGLDGKVHYADVGHLRPEFVPEKGMIVAIENHAGEENAQVRTRLRILSYLNLERLTETEGATWLDKELLTSKPEHLSNSGCGAEVRTALQQRRQWLVANALGRFSDADQFEPSRNMLHQLRERDIRRASAMMSAQVGLTHVNVGESENITGTYVRSAHLASGKYAIVQNAKQFTLVPWQPQMERFRGRAVFGPCAARRHGSSGRSAGPPISQRRRKAAPLRAISRRRAASIIGLGTAAMRGHLSTLSRASAGSAVRRTPSRQAGTRSVDKYRPSL
jgi:type IV secretory pathway VirD2 relaxase